MDPVINPFSPGAGAPPPELVGREAIFEEARILLGRVLGGRTVQSMVMTGLRGVGKTVLLGEIRHMAEHSGVLPVMVEATEEKSVGELLVAPLKKVLFDLDRMQGAKDKVKRGLVALRNFIGTIKIEVGDFGLGIEPQHGFADSGDLEYDLGELFVCVAEAAADRGKGVVVLIDEMQYLCERELGALIMAMHRMQQEALPLALVGAGLPILPGLAGNAKSYAERLFHFLEIGALLEEDAIKAIRLPLEAGAVHIDDAAAHRVFEMTHGYPYFLQEWGYRLWNYVEQEPIWLSDVEAVYPSVLKRLDDSFFRVRIERMTKGEKDFLYAMAKIESSEIKIGDVAKQLGVTVGSMGPRRSSLIRKGMIYSPAHGTIAFSVPLFGEYLLRSNRI
ncbi:MAG: ATP-binding protein [Lentisphaeria bacterium]|nr:ATP-binding protein [Lentisphaeria bacterium]